MPIHLAPISRRRFLARSVAAAAGLALSPRLLAASRPTDPNFWALFSDIHLAADRSKVARGVTMADHFTVVSSELLALPKRPAGLFINGDCAFNSGEMGDYAVVADLLRPIRADRIPVHLALGNHDNRDRFWAAFEAEKAAKRPITTRQAGLLRTKHVNWFILDSLETTLSTPGLLGREQLDWLAKTLDANANKPALILVHHNPGIEGGNMGLKDTLPFLEILRPRKQVKAYIFGHTHDWKIEQDKSGIHFVNLPPVAYVFAAGRPAGWVHATLEANGMELELRCVDRSHPEHGHRVQLDWRA